MTVQLNHQRIRMKWDDIINVVIRLIERVVSET